MALSCRKITDLSLRVSVKSIKRKGGYLAFVTREGRACYESVKMGKDFLRGSGEDIESSPEVDIIGTRYKLFSAILLVENTS